MMQLTRFACFVLVLASCTGGAEPVEPGALGVGETTQIEDFWAHCGATHLDREVSGTFWVATAAIDEIDWMPASWEQHVDAETERVALTLELQAEDRLVVTPVDGGESVIYEPTTEPVGCD